MSKSKKSKELRELKKYCKENNSIRKKVDYILTKIDEKDFTFFNNTEQYIRIEKYKNEEKCDNMIFNVNKLTKFRYPLVKIKDTKDDYYLCIDVYLIEDQDEEDINNNILKNGYSKLNDNETLKNLSCGCVIM